MATEPNYIKLPVGTSILDISKWLKHPAVAGVIVECGTNPVAISLLENLKRANPFKTATYRTQGNTDVLIKLTQGN